MASPGQQLLHLPFSAGINEAVQPELGDATQGFKTLENGRQYKKGAYDKRPGFTAMTANRFDGTTRTSGGKLLNSGRSVCVIDSAGKFDVYDPVSQTWRTAGRAPVCGVRLTPLPAPSGGNSIRSDNPYGSARLEQIEYCNGYLGLAYLTTYTPTGGTTVYTVTLGVVESTTVTIVSPLTIIATSSSTSYAPLLASYSTYLMAMVFDIGGHLVNAWYLDTSTTTTIAAGWQSMGPIVATVNTTFPYWEQVAVCSLSDRVAIAWVNDTSGTARVSVRTFDKSGPIQGTSVTTTNATVRGVDVDSNGDGVLYVAWNDGDSGFPTRVVALSATNLSSVVATAGGVTAGSEPVRCRITASSTSGEGWVAVTGSHTGRARFLIDGGAITFPEGESTLRGTGIAAHPFEHNGRFYLPLYGWSGTETDTEYNTFALVDATTGADETPNYAAPVACPVPIGLAVPGAQLNIKTYAGAIATTKYSAINVIRSAIGVAPVLIEYDFAAGERWQTVTHNNTTYLAGGCPSFFDGHRISEVGYVFRPQVPSFTLTSGAGSATTGYIYVNTIEEMDSSGNWNVSSIGNPSASTGAYTSKIVNLFVASLSVTGRIVDHDATAQTIRHAIYRTNDGGSVFYRFVTLENDFNSDTVTFSHVPADISSNPKLYSPTLPGAAGGSLDRRAPPAFQSMVSYNGMLCGAYGSDVWYSGQTVSGEATWFNPLFQVPIPGDGDIIAMETLDGTLFVFKQHEIFAIAGDAPSDNGASGGLGFPRRIASDVGCVEPRSVVSTSTGIFFKSERGIERLSRAQSVEWIGLPVQTTVNAFPVLVAATPDQKASLVRFELASSESDGVVSGTGRSLVFDLAINQWISSDRRHDSAGNVDAPAQSACIVYLGSSYKFAWLSAAGIVHLEDSTTHLDVDNWVAKRAETLPVKFAGLQGLQHMNRVLFLGKGISDHDMNVSLAYDYSNSYQASRTYTRAEINAITGVLPNLQIEHPMHDDARGEAVVVKIEDATPTGGTVGTGEGATWIGLTFEAVPQVGAYKLPDISR